MAYTTYLELTQTPHRLDSYLVIISIREPKHLWMPTPFTWTNVSGNTWKTDYPLNENEVWHIWDVFNSGVELTPDTLTAGELDTVNTWFFDLDTERAVYINIGSDPNDAKIQIGVLWGFCTDTPLGNRFTSFDIPSSIKTITANNVLFDRAVLKEGLGNIKYSLPDSAYIGSALPDFNSLALANVKNSVLDVAGKYNSIKDRFQIIDGKCVILGGDAGEVLDIADFRYFGEFRITNADLDSESLTFKLSSPFSYFEKLVPFNYYTTDERNFDENVKGQFKALFWADSVRMPTIRLNERTFAFSDPIYSPQDVDVDIIVYNGATTVDPSKYTVEDGIVIFNEAQDDDAWIEVRAKRCWDINGDPDTIQLAGAWLRQFLIQIVGIPAAIVPATSFQDFDTAFAYELIVYLEEGGGQVTCSEVIKRFEHSTFSVLTFQDGVFILTGFDIDNPPASVANVLEDELLTDITLEQDTREINACLVMLYGYKPNDKLYKQLKKTLNTAASQYKNSDTPFTIEEKSLLKKEADALDVLIKYMCRLAVEKDLIKFSATGEVVTAFAGDIINVYREVAPSESGTWNPKELKIREINLKTSKRPETTVDLILEEIITPEIRDYIVDNLDDPPASGSSGVTIVNHDSNNFEDDLTDTISIDNTGNAIFVKVEYTMTDGDPDIDPTVTWDGNAPDDYIVNASSVRVRTACFAWYGANAPAGLLDAVITFSANIARCYWTVFIMDGVTGIGDKDAAYDASGKDIELTLTTAIGDLVMDAHVASRAPSSSEHTMPAAQIGDQLSRLEYDGMGFADERSIRAIGSHRIATTTSTKMEHHDTINHRLAQTAMVLEG